MHEQLAAATDKLSRVWTLLVRQHELLWRDGAHLYGREVDEYVPPLGSRVVVKHKADPVPAPARPPLAVAHAETERLKLHFAQRSKAEMKRMTQLESLVPRLRNLVKNGAPMPGKVTKEELAPLQLLQTPQIE